MSVHPKPSKPKIRKMPSIRPHMAFGAPAAMHDHAFPAADQAFNAAMVGPPGLGEEPACTPAPPPALGSTE